MELFLKRISMICDTFDSLVPDEFIIIGIFLLALCYSTGRVLFNKDGIP